MVPKDSNLRRLIANKANKITFGNTMPNRSEGVDGDITIRNIRALGNHFCVKNNGEWTVCTAPDDQEDDMKKYLDDALSRAKFLLKNKKFQKGFKPQLEIYKGKPTGNKLMPKECSFCGYKKHCWPKAELHEKVTSKAKSKPLVWYNKLKNTEVKNL